MHHAILNIRHPGVSDVIHFKVSVMRVHRDMGQTGVLNPYGIHARIFDPHRIDRDDASRLSRVVPLALISVGANGRGSWPTFPLVCLITCICQRCQHIIPPTNSSPLRRSVRRLMKYCTQGHHVWNVTWRQFVHKWNNEKLFRWSREILLYIVLTEQGTLHYFDNKILAVVT